MSADHENGHLNHVRHVIPEGAHDLRMILGIVLNSIIFYEKPGSSNSQANYDYNPWVMMADNEDGHVIPEGGRLNHDNEDDFWRHTLFSDFRNYEQFI